VAHVLLIDDDADFLEALEEVLRGKKPQVHALDSGPEALRLLASGQGFDLILLDNKMPGMSGLEFLTAASEQGVRIPLVLMTAAHDSRTAIQATSLGAFAYVLKTLDPVDMLPELEPMIAGAVEISRRPAPVQIEQDCCADEEVEESALVGRSKPMLELFGRIARLARVDETTLILGETGTGKDLVARALHTHSHRRNGPFVVMNCAAFVEQLLDDELFGHEVGAFTSAHKLRKGRFEHANGGTLFLDEVGDMPAALQVKLLRVLENREIVRIGSNDPIRVNVRVVAATHRDLGALVREGKFRQDLYYRLEGMTIHLPPLRDRKGDIELLARVFLARIFPDRQSRPALHPLALARLRDSHWPGNVRQLQKVLCRAAGSCQGRQILAEDIDLGEGCRTQEPASGRPARGEVDPGLALHGIIEAAWRHCQTDVWPLLQERLQRELLLFALAQPGVSQVKLARRLGVSRNLLRKWLEQFGFNEPPDEGDAAPG
jgi:DNA-binding NtrC family response regulator